MSMLNATATSVTEYLQTSYRPDREYLDGEIRERNVGKYDHSRLKALLAIWFGEHEDLWSVVALTEQRVRVAPLRVRIPDVTLVSRGPQPDVLVEAPRLVIEILSPDDTYADTERRAADYLAMGVPALWIIDPETRTGRMASLREWVQADRLEVAGEPVYVDLKELFAKLDRSRQA